MLVSLVMPYYRNPRMLFRQLHIWANEWPEWLKDKVDVVVVDDGSPEPAAVEIADRPISSPAISLYRILEDRPWHQHAARNLGAHEATSPWLLMTDMDHVCPFDTMAALVESIERDATPRIITFGRRDAPAGEPWRSDHWTSMAHTLNREGEKKPHVNSFALPRALYWTIGGYDEDYCGIYGTDMRFRSRMFTGQWPVERLANEQGRDYPMIRVGREVIPDASTRDVERKEENRAHAKKAVEAEKRRRGEAHVIKTLQFPWEKVI